MKMGGYCYCIVVPWWVELIKEDIVESDAVEVEVREVFEMLEVTLVAEGVAVAVFPAAWILCFLQII